MPKDSIDELWVYKANADGFPGRPRRWHRDLRDATASSYRWVDANDRFTYVQRQLGLDEHRGLRRHVGGSKADAVGVYIKATHKFLLPLFGTTIALQDRAVMQFEPLRQLPVQARATHP